MNYTTIVDQIIGLLKNRGAWYETFEHEPVLTSEEAAKTRPGYSLHQGAKAIVAKIVTKNNGDKFVMFVFPADFRLNSKKVKESLDIKSFRFADEAELGKLTGGLQRGAIPPFGNLFSLPVYADKNIVEIDKIVFNAGDRRFSVAMESKEYIKLVNPLIVDIACK